MLCLLVSYGPLADFGGSVGGAIPRERVRRLAAGRRSVRRRRRALARWLRVPADEPEAVNHDGPGFGLGGYKTGFGGVP